MSGILKLAVNARFSVGIAELFTVQFSWPIFAIAATLARTSAFIIAAGGISHELGFAANSRLGKAAIDVWGIRDLAFLLLAMLPATSSFYAALIAFVVQPIFGLAEITAAVVITRVQVLQGWVRLALLSVAVGEVTFDSYFDSPLISTRFGRALAILLESWPIEVFEPLLTLAVALLLLTWGRLEALKHRARLIDKAR